MKLACVTYKAEPNTTFYPFQVYTPYTPWFSDILMVRETEN